MANEKGLNFLAPNAEDTEVIEALFADDDSVSGTAAILAKMATTFTMRNNDYKDNYKMVGDVMAAFFPDGVELKTADQFAVWHLFELKIVKLTRFVIAGMLHADSIHDDAVYSAMIENIVATNPTQIGG